MLAVCSQYYIIFPHASFMNNWNISLHKQTKEFLMNNFQSLLIYRRIRRQYMEIVKPYNFGITNVPCILVGLIIYYIV